MKCYVITIFGLEYSEALASKCVSSGQQFNYKIIPFYATNRFQARKTFDASGLTLNKNLFKDISDETIGDRSRIPKGQWHLTTPELGCFMSHYRLWQKCIEDNENLIIFEHDVEIISEIPRIPPNYLAVNFHQSSWPGTKAYTITPKAAQLAVSEAKTNGIQPSDDLLWRVALKNQPVFQPAQAIIKPEESEISTIQFTKTDTSHSHISKQNPWETFQGLIPGSNKTYSNTSNHSKSITLPVFTRPRYLCRTLSSLSKLNLTGYKLFINVEPGYEAVIDLINEIDFVETDIQINHEVLGVRKNPYILIERAFASGSEWNFHIEDDLVFAPDVMDLVNWYYNHQHQDVLVYGTCNRQRLTSDTGNCELVKNPISFSGLGWCINKKNWNEMVKPLWFVDSKHHPENEQGWDWNISRYIRTQTISEIIPLVSRSNTIGEYGVFSNPESYAPLKNLPLSDGTSINYTLLK